MKPAADISIEIKGRHLAMFFVLIAYFLVLASCSENKKERAVLVKKGIVACEAYKGLKNIHRESGRFSHERRAYCNDGSIRHLED